MSRHSISRWRLSSLHSPAGRSRIAEYRDEYTEKMQALIESKVEGKEIIAPPAVEEPQVLNLMDALKASVQRIAVPGKAEKPGKKMASSARSRAKQPTTRKRKSG